MGQDRQPGVFLYSDAGIQQRRRLNASQMLIANENNAMPFGLDCGGLHADPRPVAAHDLPGNRRADPTNPSSYDLQQAAQDDISNHNLQSGGAIGGSG